MEKPAYQPERYWTERLEKDFSLAGAGHSGVGLAFNRWAYHVRARVLRRTLAELHIPAAGARVLELGFGTGFYLELWRTWSAAHVTGFDITEIAVRSARERFGEGGWRFEHADIGRPLPLREAAGSCDLATAFDVLFHLTDDAAWQTALDNLAAGLKSSGHVLITDKFQRTESAVSHVRRRTLSAYREALAARGLEVVAVRPIFFFMNSPTDLQGVSKAAFKGAWSLVKAPYKLGRAVGVGEPLGSAMGALLYWPELALGWALHSGPSTKLLVARKK